MSGIAGLEAVHTWDGALVLNDRGVWPRYRVRHIGGLYGRADSENEADPAIGRIGEIPRRSFPRGKTLTYEGDTQARSLADLRAAQADLGAALAPTDEREMIVTVNPSLGPLAYRYTARCIVLEGAEEQAAPPTRTSFGYERPFVVGLRLSDPRYYSNTEDQDETSDLTTEAGVTFPLIKPVTFPPDEPAATATVTNGGNAPTDPTILLYGPVVNPRIENLTLGLSLDFDRQPLSIAEGHFLRVEFATRRVLLDGVTDARAYLDLTQSNWWDAGASGLAPGENLIRYTADTIADPAQAVILHRDAFWA